MSANDNKSKSWRDVLAVHPAADLFPMMSEPELRELGEDIKKNGLTSPIILWVPGDKAANVCLLDGRNRLDAMELVGMETVDEDGDLYLNDFLAFSDPLLDPVLYLDERPGTDPYAFVLSANIHRRHLTAKDKRELIAKVVKQTPDKSDRQIAKETDSSPTTVGKIRKEAENAGDVSKLDTRTDTKGRKQPSAKPKKSPKTASPAKNDPIGSSPVRYSEAAATSRRPSNQSDRPNERGRATSLHRSPKEQVSDFLGSGEICRGFRRGPRGPTRRARGRGAGGHGMTEKGSGHGPAVARPDRGDGRDRQGHEAHHRPWHRLSAIHARPNPVDEQVRHAARVSPTQRGA
jgi:hypothetical protein